MKSSKIPKQLLTLCLAIAMVLANFAIPLQTFAEDTTGAATPEAYMEEYVQNKIITSGGEAVVRSSDGLSYDVGLKTSNGGSITSFRFRNATAPYKMAWKVDASAAAYVTSKSHTAPSKGIAKRPASTESKYPVKVTLMLFNEETSDSDINKDVAVPLVTKDVTINLLPEDPIYSVTFKAVDSVSQEAVNNANITVEKDFSSVTSDNGVYKMPKGVEYSVKATADGYRSYSNYSFTATADGEVKLPLEKILTKNITFDVKDGKGSAVSNPEIKVKKGYTAVNAESDGSYKMEQGQEYSYTITATGFKDVTGKITPAADTDNVISINMTPVITHKITFNITDKKGNAIEDAKLTVEKDYDEIKPEKDGSYLLEEGVKYNYTVKRANYETVSSKEFTVTKDETITVALAKNITNYNVTLNIKDNKGQAVPNPVISITYEYDDGWDYYTETVEPVSGTTYVLDKWTEYTVTVSAGEGYTKYTDYTYTPSGDEENITLDIVLRKMTADQKKADAIVKKFNSEYGPLRPAFKTEKNVNDTVLNQIKKYTDLDVTGVTVEVAASADVNVVALDGTIKYKKDAEPNQTVKNIGCTFKIKCGDGEAVTGQRVVQVGWDQDYFNSKIQADAKALTINSILGENTSKDALTKDLRLVRINGDSMQKVWSSAEWVSSDPEVISIEKPSIDSPIYPETGKIHPQEQDKTVTLTATFKANDVLLNSNFEKVDQFASVPVSFTVTVKGTAPPKPTQAELLKILDTYYTNDLFLDSITSVPVDFSKVQGDILLPRYTKIKDENQKLVFENKEITVESDNTSLITINGYRANVDAFAPSNTANLTIKFTRQGVTATKTIPVTVVKVTDEELDAEIAKMEIAKNNYFQGINDNTNTDKDHIVNNLHAFMEMRLDSENNPVWIYEQGKKVGDGIVPDNFFEDPWEMESNGYNRFKSSAPDIIKHDNLLVTRPEIATDVTISSILSSAKYGKFAPKHPENAKLQKLYKQEAKVTVKVTGTKLSKQGLADIIKEAGDFAESMVTGTGSGQYPEAAKANLNSAVSAAEKVFNNADATDEQYTNAANTLKAALEKAKADKNFAEVNLTITGTPDKNLPGFTISGKVKADEAAKAGLYKKADYAKEVTALDAIAFLHREMYGQDFVKNPSKYLKANNDGWISTIFGVETGDMGFLVNGLMPSTTSNQTVLKDNDKISIFLFYSPKYSDLYLEFDKNTVNIKQGEEFTLTLKGHPATTGVPDKAFKAQKGFTVTLQSVNDQNLKYSGKTDANGVVTLKPLKPGKYTATVTAGADYFVTPCAEVNVEKIKADYSFVEQALAEADEVNRLNCKDLTALDNAINAVIWDKDISEQDVVDGYASAINDAINALEPLDIPENGVLKSDTETAATTADAILRLDGSLEVVLAGNKIVYDKESVEAIQGILGDADEKVSFILEEIKADSPLLNKAQKDAIAKGNMTKLYSVMIVITDNDYVERTVSEFQGGIATITVKYNKADKSDLKVYKVNSSGELTEMDSSYAEGSLTWKTPGHSVYMVSEKLYEPETKPEVKPEDKPENKPGVTPSKPDSGKTPAVTPAPEKGSVVPKTGDMTDLGMWTAIALVAAMAAILIVFARKKFSHKNK